VRANACLVESLRLSAELDSMREMAVAIAALVLAAAAAGDAQRAARLVGATQALLDRAGCDVPPFLREQYESGVAMLRQRAGVGQFRQWVIAGQSMAPADIIADAMASGGPIASAGDATGSPLTPYAPLSAREWEIARIVAHGLKNREVAEALVLAERTVGSHLERMYNRLGIRSRVQLTAWAVERDAGHLENRDQLASLERTQPRPRRSPNQLRVVGD